MFADAYYSFGLVASITGLACGLFFFMYSVRYYLVSIFVLLKDQQAMERDMANLEEEKSLGFSIHQVDMIDHYKKTNKKTYRRAKVLGFKKARVQNEKLITEVASQDLGYNQKTISSIGQDRVNALAEKLRNIFWEIKKTKNQIIVRPARLGIRKRIHALLIMIMKKADYDEIKKTALAWMFDVKSKLFHQKSWTIDKNKHVPQTSTLKQLNYKAGFLGFETSKIGITPKGKRLLKKNKHYINRENIKLIDDPVYQPFVSIHLAFYNEENVAERVIDACLNQDYKQYEIVIADDSTDRTPEVIKKYKKHKNIKILRRDNREGYKGGALKEAIKHTDPRAEHIIVFDADFVPPPGTIKMFLQEFYRQNGNSLSLDEDKNLAAVQGYQWHVLNKDENFVTSGIRFGFAGGYMVERTAQQYFGAMKMIAGSVFIIRRDVMEKFTWQMDDGYTSIVEDWNLTIRMYLKGWKIGYTPDIKVPAECVNSLNKLARQQIRWAEGHTWNVKTYFWQVMTSAKMTLIEKLEFLQYAPFYLQAALFIVGTVGWIVGELIFHIKVPGWTATLGWSLVFTNLMALPVMCISGLVLERGEDRDYNFLPFLTYIYYIIPHLTYASLKGLFSPYEGGWVRTKKTGSVTDAIIEPQMAGSQEEMIEKNKEMMEEELKDTAKKLSAEHKLYAYQTKQTEELNEDNRFWMELKRVPRLGMALVVIMAIMLGSLGYLASGVNVEANPDVLYLNSYQYLSTWYANNPTSVEIGNSNPSYSWYSSICPTGDDDGGIAAGNYSTQLSLLEKPYHDKVYSFTVGHVDASGGDYQYVTSTTYVINQSTPDSLVLNLGNGPEIICTQENPRKLMYTVAYEYSLEGCDEGSICDEVSCDDDYACNTGNNQEVELAQENNWPYIEVAHAAKKDKKDKKDKDKQDDSVQTIAEEEMTVMCVEPDCETDTINGYEISYNGSTYNSSLDQTTFSYTITGDGAYRDLSNNVFELCAGTDVVSYSPDYGVEIGTDPNSGIYGIKWEIELSPYESRDYSFTLSGYHCEACVQAGVKVGRYVETGTIMGPSCEFCPQQEIELTVENDCGGINLEWDEYTDEYITGYKLLRSTSDPDLTYPEDGYYKYLTPGSTTTYTDTAVTQDQGYYYRIGAYYSGEILSYSNTVYIEADTLCAEPVIPTIQCMDDNGDGTYTAHFGYDNQNANSVNIPIGWRNKFIPDPIDRGQPEEFDSGVHEDIFSVNFDGSEIQWKLKGPDDQIRYATADSETPLCVPPEKVSPVLECVDENPDGTYTAHFGYNNRNDSTTYIPIGSNNKFTPTPIDRGQTEYFLPGRQTDVYTVDFDGSNLVWTLKSPNGQTATATASSSSERCPIEHCCCDNLVVEYNNGYSLLYTPHIIVPEATLLLGLPALFGLWYGRRKRKGQK